MSLSGSELIWRRSAILVAWALSIAVSPCVAAGGAPELLFVPIEDTLSPESVTASIDGIDDIMAYETFPAGTHVRVRKGETLYVHCYAHNFSPERTGYFHHMVRVLYW